MEAVYKQCKRSLSYTDFRHIASFPGNGQGLPLRSKPIVRLEKCPCMVCCISLGNCHMPLLKGNLCCTRSQTSVVADCAWVKFTMAHSTAPRCSGTPYGNQVADLSLPLSKFNKPFDAKSTNVYISSTEIPPSRYALLTNVRQKHQVRCLRSVLKHLAHQAAPMAGVPGAYC